MSTAMWDRRAGKYDDAIKNHDDVYNKTIESTKALLNNSDVVLDFACASAEISLDIAPYVERVHGIDTSAKMIELAKNKALDRQIDNTSFDQVDAFDPSLNSYSFSAIIAFSIFHLLGDPQKVLARLNNLMDADGFLITQTPCLGERGWIIRLLIGIAQKLGIAPYIRGLTIAELESLVSSNGFEVIESRVWDSKNAIQWVVARKV